MSPEILESRLRRLLSGLDAREGFEERLRSRIAGLGGTALHELEARREALRRRLRRDAWMNAATLAGIGAAAAALAWHHAPLLVRVLSGEPLLVAAASCAALAVPLWAAFSGFRAPR